MIPISGLQRAVVEALDALGVKGTWAIQGRELALTNLNKVLFPGREGEEPITKRDLIRYHAQVAPYLLPYLYDLIWRRSLASRHLARDLAPTSSDLRSIGQSISSRKGSTVRMASARFFRRWPTAS